MRRLFINFVAVSIQIFFYRIGVVGLQLTGGDFAILIKNILIDGLDSTRSASEYMKKVDVEEYERSEKDCMWERD